MPTACYSDSTYNEVMTWTAGTRIRYAPNKKSGKSFDRYGGYMAARTVGEALARGSFPLDLTNDFEKGLLKSAGGPKRKRPPEVTKDNCASLSCTDRVLGRLYCRWQKGTLATTEQTGLVRDAVMQVVDSASSVKEDESEVDDSEAPPASADASRSVSPSSSAESIREASSSMTPEAAALTGQAAGWWKEAGERWRDTITPDLRVVAAQVLVRHSAKRSGDAAEAAGAPPQKRGTPSPGGRPPATPHRGSAGGPVSSPMSGSPGGMRLSKATETCSICCSEVPPYRAVQLGCRHGWYCNCCMERHAQGRLEIGAVDVPCFECNAPLPERHLRKLLPEPLLERLLARSLEQAVSAASDLRSCPTPNCPVRVALEQGAQPKLNCCPQCRKSSCLLCGAQPWHRGLTCEQHAEKRQGKDDELFQKWMEETGTKQCPQCSCPVTKQNLDQQSTQRAECHKMMCRNCTCRFCFKCLSVLTSDYTCGCTSTLHGFIDPKTGRRREHIKPTKIRARGR